jgi:hypothetical protein
MSVENKLKANSQGVYDGYFCRRSIIGEIIFKLGDFPARTPHLALTKEDLSIGCKF